ncbi:hypothetical protein EG028_20970 [Chitinophaga barathri]|uniref:Outer membrane protein beta-barrel domain-containing protein n=1 Tax=Chitinophaga barathri TaxID=1647451 RepID=A0A3N4MUH3_9BACT|nr:hypothetical protein EG028_20970 [Chitinophaga barathri]
MKTVMLEVPAGLRVGVDLTRFAIPFFQPYRRDATVVLDARYNDRIYFAADISYNRTSHSDSNYTYKGSGVGISIGANYNLLKKQIPKENFMLYGGFKYGFSLFSYEIPSYTIHSTYWGNYQGSMPSVTKTGHWVELSLGIKVEVLKNLYLGWSLHERILLNSAVAKSDFPPLIIPGYGKGYKGSAFDMQYTISYLFPMWKVKQQMKLK